jgi:hypothetical protein
LGAETIVLQVVGYEVSNLSGALDSSGGVSSTETYAQSITGAAEDFYIAALNRNGNPFIGVDAPWTADFGPTAATGIFASLVGSGNQTVTFTTFSSQPAAISFAAFAAALS